MPNVIIPLEHQAAPTFRYDKGLEREAEQAEALDRTIAKRRAMRNEDLDRELHAPGHDDPLVEMLRQRAAIQRVEHEAAAWVDENLEVFETNCMRAQSQHMEGQERWQGKKNQEMRLVNILHPHTFIRRLQRAGVDARLEEHRNARIWLNDWSKGGLCGVNAWMKPQELSEEGYLEQLRYVTTERQRELLTMNFLAAREGRKVRETITTIQYPYAPEYSIMRFNEHGAPTREKYRGWRTTLLALIIAGVVTEEECDRAFGPAIGPAGEFYRKYCKTWRQIRVGRAI